MSVKGCHRAKFIFRSKKLWEASLWWHAFPVEVALDPKKTVEIVRLDPVAKCWNLSVTDNVTQEAIDIAVAQPYHIDLFLCQKQAKILIWRNADVTLPP